MSDNYSGIITQVATIATSLTSLVSAASGVLHVVPEYSKLTSVAETPAASVMLVSVNLEGVRETNRPTATFDVVLKTRGTDEVDMLAVLANVMAKLEDYTIDGDAAGVEFSDVDIYRETEGMVGAIYAVINMIVTI